MTLRIHLAGRMAVTGHQGTVFAEELPGRQARLLLAFLLLHGRHPVSCDAIADAVWGGHVPPSAAALLKTLVSRTRTALRPTGAPVDRLLAGLGGSYQLRLPADTWLDVEAAARAIDRAESLLRRGDVEAAWAEAAVAFAVSGRPLLPQEDAPWLADARDRLRATRIRSIDVLVEAWLARDVPPLALELAAESVRLAPLREPSWRLLVRAHEAAGDNAEALGAYQRCTALLRAELGVDPAPETRALGARILAAGRPRTGAGPHGPR